MRALVKAEAGPGLKLQEKPIPEIGDHDVLIKVHKAAICGTDVHIWKWDEWAEANVPLGLTTGHEYMGVIAEMGAGVEGLTIGQRVTSEGHLWCHKCHPCRMGKIHLCTEMLGTGRNLDGAFADYVAVPAENIVPLPDSISDELACLLDPLGNAVYSSFSVDVIGADVLITGAGPVGIMSAAVCRRVGARRVVITDIDDDRLALARKLGATHTVNITREKVEGRFTAALEMSGAPEALETILDKVEPGSEVALLGILPKGGCVDWTKVIFKGITLKGIFGREIFTTWHKMTQLIESGLDISPLITHRFPLEEYEEGFATMIGGKSGRVILEING